MGYRFLEKIIRTGKAGTMPTALQNLSSLGTFMSGATAGT